MTKDATAFFEGFNALIKSCEIFCSIARDSELQRDACRKLEYKILEVQKEKNTRLKATMRIMQTLFSDVRVPPERFCQNCECGSSSKKRRPKMHGMS